jgi:hypothetical protein
MTGLDMRREPMKLVSVTDKWLPTTFCTFLSKWRRTPHSGIRGWVADSRSGTMGDLKEKDISRR